MKAAYLKEIKQQLNTLPAGELAAICLRLARFKKENKELITYLLFEAHDEQAYITAVKREIEKQFAEINSGNIYYAKKSIRKILRRVNTYCRYSGKKQTEVELHIWFLRCLKQSGINVNRSTALMNLYDRQVQKIKKTIGSLHEDLQHDYGEELKPLLRERKG